MILMTNGVALICFQAFTCSRSDVVSPCGVCFVVELIFFAGGGCGYDVA